jgi:toxin YoeB
VPQRDIAFTQDGWEDYLFWQKNDRAIVDRINTLLKDISRGDPFLGIGKPEALRHALSGAWSRRINHEHRLVYLVTDSHIIVLQARFHY